MNIAKILAVFFATLATIILIFPSENPKAQSLLCLISYVLSFLSPFLDDEKNSKYFKICRLIAAIGCIVAVIVFIVRSLSDNENVGTFTTTTPSETVSTMSEVPSTAVPTTIPPVSTTSPSEVTSNGTMKIVGKKMICTANSESAIFEYTFKAEKDKRHRLEFYNSDVTNSFYVTVEDERGEEISSGSSSNGGLVLEDLKRGESYTIHVAITHFENSFDFSIEIMEPDN